MPSKWIQWIALIEFWYNSSPHSSLGRSPFEVLYGFPPRNFGIAPPSVTPVADLNTWLDDRALMTSVIQLHLGHAQTRMKRQADKRRSERSFFRWYVGLPKATALRAVFTCSRANQKLAFRFFGPYKILECIGAASYRLALPPSTLIHPVFHVSQLNASHGKLPMSDILPDDLAQF
jgi:hypothetical protein